MSKREKHDPFAGYDPLLTIFLQTMAGLFIELLIINIFLPEWLSLPIVSPEWLTPLSRATFIALSLGSFAVILSGYFSFIMFVIGPYVLIKTILKRLKRILRGDEDASS